MKSRKLIYVLVVVLLLSLLAGCAGTEKPVQSEDVSEGTEPVKDSINVVISGDVATLDPHFSALLCDMQVFVNIYNSLIDVNKFGEFSPCLAEEWDISEDKMTYTFKLRKGVKFHNGEELKASDVVFSLNRAKSSPFLANQTETIKEVAEIDENTVKVTLTEPYAPFLLSVNAISILNEKAVKESGEAYGENPVGTGPYKFVCHDVGERVVLERHEEYFEGPAEIKDVEFQIITDPNTAVIALETGEVDFTYSLPMIARQGIIDNPELTTHEVDSINLIYLLMNMEKEPFNNVLVRQAMNYAVDKDTIIQIVLEGMGIKTENIFNEYTFGYSENVKGYEYNPEKAKELLIEAGYPDGFEVILNTIEGGPKKMIEIVQENLKNIGIPAEIEVNEGSAYMQDLISGNYEMGFMGITLGQDVEFYSACFKTDDGFNLSKYSNQEIDKMFNEGKKTIDRNERLKIYEKLTQKVLDDAVIVPLYFPIKVYGADKDLNIYDIDISAALRIYDMSW